MAINPALLVSVTSFQEPLVDKNGAPLTAGVVSLYQDANRSILKNWYQQTGTPGSYTYVALPNPMILSAAGTLEDSDGNDIIPFFYPYSEDDSVLFEPYYITVYSSEAVLQFTRSNFPFVATSNVTPDAETSNSINYINNNIFWRNVGSMDLSTETNVVVCPSVHATYQYPDIRFIKTNNTGVDSVSFEVFPSSNELPLTGDPTPEYYLSHTCSNIGTGQAQKFYSFPIALHTKNLNLEQFTVSIQARSSINSSLSLFIFQDRGTGASLTEPFLIQTFSLSNSWTKYVFTSFFPTGSGAVLSEAGDDAYYLQVGLPVGAVSEVEFTKPSLYLGDTAPTLNLSTYDEINAIIDAPRTGDIRVSLNNFYPFGWVPANDGTIGSPESNATTRANTDTYSLFKLIWESVDVSLAPIFTSSGVSTTKGSSAYDDFVANKQLSLTRQMGRMIAGTGSGQSLTTRQLGEFLGNESKTLSINELPAHTHNTNFFNVNVSTFTTDEGALRSTGTTGASVSKTTTSVGSDQSFSLMNPVTFYNVFFKL